MMRHGLIKIADDLQEAKACYLDQREAGVRAVIKRDHRHRVWLVERCEGRQQSSLDRLASELLDVGQKIVINRKKLEERLSITGRAGLSSGSGLFGRQSKALVERVSIEKVLGFKPENAPYIRSDKMRRLGV
jgi:hypothetical protein